GASQATVRAGHGTVRAAVEDATADLSAALRLAAEADAAAVRRLTEVAAATAAAEAPPAASTPLPPCTARPAEVRSWWDTLAPEQRRWLAATEPGWLGRLDGVPAAFRDLANRLLLDEHRAELDRAASSACGSGLRRLDGLRQGLGALADRLAGDAGPRGYLLRLDLAGDGRAVVALGDPDRADNILTQVPGMTADLASYGGELSRAERVAVRAAQLDPSVSTSAVMWLDYDAPDFVDEAAGASRAEAGADGLRRFQEGLRATHDGGPAHQTVLGHSYGSLVVGRAAAGPGLDADSVVFVGSPGVGVDSAAQLHVPSDQIWSTTSRSDIIQYAAVAPRSVIEDVFTAVTMPVIGPAVAFATPEDELWFGRNPSDPAFGARVFGSQPDAGHLGYWDPGRPALDAIASITLGTAL
ncbi:MAG TPA: alpha/beta hydrolase, partial [Actinoplanes sp.]|nr:alpha/beta hydrolase [Actinoplanes sp.]